jgi:hypothetical protein
MSYLVGKTIKLHALIHTQLQATIYRNMVRYAWYAAKLITSHEVICSVNQATFLAEEKTEKILMQQANIHWMLMVTEMFVFWSHLQVPSRLLQACLCSLMCSVLFWYVKLHYCTVVVCLQSFTLRSQLRSSLSRVSAKEEIKHINGRT